MADQDFNITIRTIADTTGIRLTQQQLTALQTAAAEGNQKAITALNQLKSAASASGIGFTGAAVGVGTLLTVMGATIRRVQQFNEEQDKIFEKMEKAREKSYALSQSIIEMQDDVIRARQIGLLPLSDQLVELQKDFARLKTEQSLLNISQQGEEWKKYASQIAAVEVQIKRLTGALQEQDAVAQKAAEKRQADKESFMKGALGSASPQVQATLQAEDQARRFSEAGEGNKADRLTRKAEALKRGMTQRQREEYEGLTKPEIQMDDITRNKINFDRQLRGEPPLPTGNVQGQNSDLVKAIEDLKRELIGVWQGN